MNKDLKSNVDIVESLAPASRTAAVNGTGVDLRGYSSAMAVIQAGAAGGTTPSFTFKVQESDDDSTYADVAAADLDGGQPAAITAAQAAVRIGYKGAKRYARVIISAVSGTSPTLLCSAAIVRGTPILAKLA